MIPEIGHFALIIAFCLSIILAVIPSWGAWRRNTGAMALAPGLAVAAAAGLCAAFAGTLEETAVVSITLAAAKPASDDAALPVDAHATAVAPSSIAFTTASDDGRSLSEPPVTRSIARNAMSYETSR